MSILREASDDEVLIQELLEDICNITLKIKRELDEINNLVKHNGEFSSAVAKTNQTLLEVIKDSHIDLSFIEENESENANDDNDKKKNTSSASKNK